MDFVIDPTNDSVFVTRSAREPKKVKGAATENLSRSAESTRHQTKHTPTQSSQVNIQRGACSVCLLRRVRRRGSTSGRWHLRSGNYDAPQTPPARNLSRFKSFNLFCRNF
ncbi:hypothetical protein GWI33_022361 [Rhynchophorus ferrugineus]|uniref:Uncharacterized protein n=1 Tax=Rhynchophorus ferrugineus TaxID=354439 RepID=A0A834M248_RHYFE|nr:hypothetical protein GWI33_022361 [Rhynchophorus ferrugineus]